jgi:Zn-dependent protease with chaperone function
MTREEFDAFVQRVENGIGRNPAALRWRVAWLAALGYFMLLAGMFLVALLAAAFFSGIYWADLEGKILCGFVGLLILVGGGAAMLRALLVRVPPPKGIPILRAEAPALYGMLDDLQAQLNSVPFHHVQLMPVHNAAVVQVPRLGMLGWSTNYLLVGLPLLDGHSPDEIRAIMAHEFAHLSRQHGRFSHWIYRLRRSWESIFVQLSRPDVRRQASLRPLMTRWVEFFWPRFNAHAFVFSRANEYEADALAAKLTSPETMANALIRSSIQDLQLDQKFWPDLWQLATNQSKPPADVLSRLRNCLRQQTTSDERSRWLTEALRVSTTNADTHPCLSDRLRALHRLPNDSSQIREPFAAPPTSSAAEVFLGPALEKFRPQAEQLWCNDVNEIWVARHAKAGALAHRLSAVEQSTQSTEDVDSLWDKAIVIMDLKGNDAAEPLLRRILAARPQHVSANFHLGRILLERGNDDGMAFVERAISDEPDVTPQGCALLMEHYRRAGLSNRIREVELRLDCYEKDLVASRVERQEVTARDPLIPHGLGEEDLSSLLKALAEESDLMRAELGRKALRHFPNQKLFLLCVHGRKAWYGLRSSERDQELINRLTQKMRLPGRVLVFTPRTGHRALSRKLRMVDGAAIFHRTNLTKNSSQTAP